MAVLQKLDNPPPPVDLINQPNSNTKDEAETAGQRSSKPPPGFSVSSIHGPPMQTPGTPSRLTQQVNRLSAAYVPTALTQKNKVIEDLLSRYRSETAKSAARRGYDSKPLHVLQDELENVRRDQETAEQTIKGELTTAEWFEKYKHLFPNVVGIIAIEELYQKNVPIARAAIVMTETEARQKLHYVTPQPTPKQHSPCVDELFLQAVIYNQTETDT